MPQSIHFIAIGGSAMHNLALALQQQGHVVTGSDDVIYEPSRSRLQQQGLLPEEHGWFPEKIHGSLDAVIVGMHARNDNPELLKALRLGLNTYSYPEFIYQQSQQKQRIVIAGSHGKTTITAIILHTLQYHNRLFDYWIGDAIEGFSATVRFSANAPIIIIEGDEYASSPVDSRPKFLHYQPHIALISGIAWDHISLYPTWEEYVDQFESLAEAMPKAGILLFDESDDMLDVIGQKDRTDITKIPYVPHPSVIRDGKTYLLNKQSKQIPINLFGEHNLKNIAGAMLVCDRVGITEEQFYASIPSFIGVSGRLEKIAEGHGHTIYHDLAQSPAKIEAITTSLKHQYPTRKLIVVVELCFNYNVNKDFLEQYRHTLDAADIAVLFIGENLLRDAANQPLNAQSIGEAFERSDVHLFTDENLLKNFLLHQQDSYQIVLLINQGAFRSLTTQSLAGNLIEKFN